MKQQIKEVLVIIVIMLIFTLSLCWHINAHAGDLPDPMLTPGKLVDGMTTEKVCTTKWGKDERFVTAKMKREVTEAYHFDVNDCPLTLYKGQMVHRSEMDHLYSRELGGADDVKNIWPQCYEPVPDDKSWQLNGAHKKDALENKLHNLVCVQRTMSLEQAQDCIASDWVDCYGRVMK